MASVRWIRTTSPSHRAVPARSPSSCFRSAGIEARQSRSSSTVPDRSAEIFAVASRIDSSNVRGYEAGRGLMNVQSLVRDAEALEVDAGELLSGVTSEMFVQGRIS